MSKPLFMLTDEELSELAGFQICAISKVHPKELERLRAAIDYTNREKAELASAVLGRCHMLQIRENGMPQVDALINAGWLFEPVGENSEPWQWAWRRPARRKGSKGMRFASTNQAYQALRRMSPNLPDIRH